MGRAHPGQRQRHREPQRSQQRRARDLHHQRRQQPDPELRLAQQLRLPGIRREWRRLRLPLVRRRQRPARLPGLRQQRRRLRLHQCGGLVQGRAVVFVQERLRTARFHERDPGRRGRQRGWLQGGRLRLAPLGALHRRCDPHGPTVRGRRQPVARVLRQPPPGPDQLLQQHGLQQLRPTTTCWPTRAIPPST